MSSYRSFAPAFAASPECKFVKKILGIFNKKKINIYTNADVQKYLFGKEIASLSRVRVMTEWEEDLLNKIKNISFL